MSYQVGIDLGSTSAVAAVCRGGGRAQVVPLEGRAGTVPAVVYVGTNGELLVGEAAERHALTDPGRVVRELTRRIGDGTPLLVGHEPVAAEELAARFLARLVDDVARREGGVAAGVAVTHPAAWGPHRVGSLQAALATHGLGSALLVPEPVAAAAGYAGTTRVEPGAALGVYDLGGGRFDAAVARRCGTTFELAGTPEAIERFGGADLDEVVFSHVRGALGDAWETLDAADPDVLAAVAELRRQCTAAKEALSHDTEVLVPVTLPGMRTPVRLGRAEFEEMIRPAIEETVEAMRLAVDGAGVEPAALVLVGGSSRIPLVPQLLGEAFGRDVATPADPEGAVALGAALVGGGAPRPAGAARRPVPGPRGHRALDAEGQPAGDPGAGAPAAAPYHPEEATTTGTAVLPVARPPKQARPFVADVAEPTGRRGRVVLVASAAALALAVLGGVAAYGFERLGAGTEAGAVTPTTTVDTGAPESTAELPDAPAQVRTPAAPPPSPPGRRGRPVAPVSTTTARPPAGTTAPPVKIPDEQQETGAPEPTGVPGGGGTAGGDSDAGNGDAGNGDAGNGGAGNGGAGGGGNGEAGALRADPAARRGGGDPAGSAGGGGGAPQAVAPAGNGPVEAAAQDGPAPAAVG
jgi:actin-like ATPase involved in cell morphogenesis